MVRMLATFGWVPVAIAAIATLALLPALPLLAYLHGFGAQTASSLLFVEAVVHVTAGLIPLAMVARARSVAGVAAAEIVVAATAGVVVTALLPAGIGAAAAAIPAWWIAALAARSACTAIAGRLALDRELAGVYLVMELAAIAVRAAIALIAGSASTVIAASMWLHVAILVTVIALARRRPIAPARLAAPTGWGTWLASLAEDLPLPLAVVWLGGVGITAPLLGTLYVTVMTAIPFSAILSREKIERSVRMIFAPALALGFLLAERTLAPALYSWLFPSLAIHRAWFEALGWLGVGLVAVPLPPEWQLSQSERSRLATALLGLAAIFVGGFAGLTGLVVGAGIARVLQQRRDPPEP